MLFPEFDDLVTYRHRKADLISLSQRSVKSAVAGNHRSPFRGQGLEFDSVREYVPGDDIRNIDWRVTARTGSPHLKLFNEERERHRIICVDMNATMRFGTRNTFKSVQAARAAALLGWQGLANHDSVSGCLYGDVPGGIHLFPPARTCKSLCCLLKMLSKPPSDTHLIPLKEVTQQISQTAQTGSLIYLISDFMDLDGVNLTRLKKRGDVVLIAVNDPADTALCPLGMLGFRNPNAEQLFVNTDNLAGREAYATQWKENRQRLHEITSQLKIPVIAMTTESDIRRDLILGLKMLAKRKPR